MTIVRLDEAMEDFVLHRRQYKKIRSVRGSLLRSSFFQVCNFIISSFNTVLSLDLFKGLIFQAANKLHQSISKRIQKFQTTYDSAGIEHFTVA